MDVFRKTILILSAAFIFNSCGGGGSSVSILPTTDAFDETDLDFNPKMDILWVVDPSRSMKEEVETVRNNIQDFISDFITKGYDYQMGVISTAAWSEEAYQADNSLSLLRDGSDPLFARLHQGECVDNPNASSQPGVLSPSSAPDIGSFVNLFETNFDVYGLDLGTSGCGLDFFTNYAPVAGNIFANYSTGERSTLSQYISDERPLQSLRAYLNDDKNNSLGFVREDAFLAIIIVSDEYDGSRDSLSPELTFEPNKPGEPAIPGNHTAQEYIDFIRDNIKAGQSDKFAIYSIVDKDLEDINISEVAAGSQNSFDIKASREVYLDNLNKIKGEILTKATAYPLGREPVTSTIKIEIIRVSGEVVEVPKANGGDGWTYEPDNGEFGSIVFTGQYIPAQGDGIVVDYTPKNLSPGEIEDPYLSLAHASVLENAGGDIGSVTLKNDSILETDTAVFSLNNDTKPGAFSIDANTGLISVLDASLLDTETSSSEQVTVDLDISHEDTSTTNYERTFTIRILDEADVAPVATDFEVEVSESIAGSDGIVRVTGNTSFYTSGLDASEQHTYAIETSPVPAGLTLNADGSFAYAVDRSSLNLDIGDPDYELIFEYKVTGTSPDGGITPADEDTAQVTIRITPANNAPEYLTSNPINNGDPVEPNNDGVSFGQVPLEVGDVNVSGTASGSVANLIGAGDANFETAGDANNVHDVLITFPDNKIYEVGCVRIYRDDSASLGNAIYQILTPGGSAIPISREVFPVGISSNSNRQAPASVQGACANTSSNYFTIYTERDFIGGKIRLIRPFGAKNPQGDASLKLDKIEVYGIEAKYTTIDLMDHFSDADITGANGQGDTLEFFVTDAYGEGPAPGWASIVGTELRLLPSASVNDTIGVVARDLSGAEAFTTIEVIGSGGGVVANAPPISLQRLDDTKRGGLSMRRWGGRNVAATCTLPSGKNKLIEHMEIDNFIEKPYISLSGGYYDITSDSDQDIHMGDTTKSEPEDGWCSAPVHEDFKYPTASASFCSGTNFDALGNVGKIIPCINSSRSYGEIYSGYFVPAVTGVYKFRTRKIDNTILLRMAPSEYLEDTKKLFLANWKDSTVETALRSLINYPDEDLGSSEARNSEFAGVGSGSSLTNYRAIPYDTSVFFDLNKIPSAGNYGGNYSDGYIYLTQGNVYAFEMRFGEGGGGVHFDFEYNRKDLNSGSNWDGWTPMDASVVVPSIGASTAHAPLYLEVSGSGVVSTFDASKLFYDAELDLLEYSARLVNADGSEFGSGQISEIGLSIGVLSGQLEGSLNNTYTNLPADQKPRVIFKAKERFAGSEAESLPIKFESF